MDEVQYMRMEEDRNMALFLQEMTEKLKAIQGSRCGDFIVGFGGKDADVDPGGCTGIGKVAGVDEEERTLVEVAGHKTFGYSGVRADQRDAYHEALTSELSFEGTFDCDGDSEGLTAGFSATIAVPYDEDHDAHARAIIKAAEERCDLFEDAMRRIVKSMERPEGGDEEDEEEG